MWKIKQQGLISNGTCTIKHLTGFQWESSGNSNEDEITEAINLYYHSEAKRGLQNIIKKKKYSNDEFVQRLNIAKGVSPPSATYINIKEIGSSKTYSVTLYPLASEFTSDLLDNWLLGKEEIPYSAFLIMRAAVNDKFMSHESKGSE